MTYGIDPFEMAILGQLTVALVWPTFNFKLEADFELNRSLRSVELMIELTLAERAVQTHFSGEIQIPSLPQLTFSQRGVIHCGSLESHPIIKIS